jgi:RNA polymerase sigma-70 factor (ECF subfamily)
VTKTAVSPQYVDVNEEPDRPPGEGPFDSIYEGEFDYVWRSLGRLGVPEAGLGDAAHEVFLVLHRKWNEIDHSRSLRPWLYGVARKVAAGVRAKRREIPTENVDLPEPIDPIVAQRRLLWRALSTLDDDRRDVVILHDLEGYTGAEIAEQLDISINTVHSRLRLARVDLVAAVERLK